MATWSLRDSSITVRESKYTFFKSTASDIAQIQTGENVKLIFDFVSDDPAAPEAERMWVIVDEINTDGTFIGRLDNTPRWIKDLQLGNTIAFDSRHIINTEHDNEDNLVNKYLARCFVTNRILRDGQRIGYLYREEPDTKEDSGWRFLAGDEIDEYMDNSDNLAFVSIGAVLSRDDSILSLLEESCGSSFQRDPESDEFNRVET
jgi:hypothetical protein